MRGNGIEKVFFMSTHQTFSAYRSATSGLLGTIPSSKTCYDPLDSIQITIGSGIFPKDSPLFFPKRARQAKPDRGIVHHLFASLKASNRFTPTQRHCSSAPTVS